LKKIHLQKKILEKVKLHFQTTIKMINEKKELLRRARVKEKNGSILISDNLKKLEDDFNNKLEKINEEKEIEKNKKKKVEEQLKKIQ
jgi:hypothetical protein